MANLTLPLWIVTERNHVRDSPNPIPCNDPFAPHAFTSREKLTAFLDEQEVDQWDVKFKLVADSDAALMVIADAKERGATHICFDPEADGSGGELISIVDVLAAFEGDGK